MPRTQEGTAGSWAEWDPEELLWLSLLSKLVLPTVSPACQDPALGVCISLGFAFSSVLRDE